jgi:hypothetical protein
MFQNRATYITGVLFSGVALLLWFIRTVPVLIQYNETGEGPGLLYFLFPLLILCLAVLCIIKIKALPSPPAHAEDAYQEPWESDDRQWVPVLNPPLSQKTEAQGRLITLITTVLILISLFPLFWFVYGAFHLPK